jgi:DNA-binding response OmpR family regulator
MAKVLVVEDEPDMRELISHSLKEAGLGVVTASNGRDALSTAAREMPDIILLDLMIPEMDGFEVCKALRRDAVTEGIPIIVVSARSLELDRVLALELGAEDYVTKPFSPRELLLRIRRSLERRPMPVPKTDRMTFDELTIDIAAHRVLVGGVDVGVTATEFRLLMTLAGRRGRVQSRDQLLSEVWNCLGEEVDIRTVDTHVRRLRDKLKEAARFIDTVRGVGYRFHLG